MATRVRTCTTRVRDARAQARTLVLSAPMADSSTVHDHAHTVSLDG